MRYVTPLNASRFMLALTLGTMTLGAAPPPDTRPADSRKEWGEWGKELGATRWDEPGKAEVGWCMLPPEASPAIEQAAGDASLPAAARERLGHIVERQRPWQAARLRRQ